MPTGRRKLTRDPDRQSHARVTMVKAILQEGPFQGGDHR